MEGWLRICNIALAAGATLLFIGVAGALLGGLFDVDLDFDGDSGFDGPIPIYGSGIAFALVVLGAVGRLLVTRMSLGWAILLTILLAAAGYWVLVRCLIAPMRRSMPRASRLEDMVGQEGKMRLTAREDFLGTVLLLSASGSMVSYSACPEPGVGSVLTGQRVEVIGFDAERKVLIVRALKDKKEEEYGRNVDHCHHCGCGAIGCADSSALDMEEGSGG